MNISFKKNTIPYVKPERGFTLIETLIAILVLTLSIVGPFEVVQGVLNSAYNARDQLTGAGLAQEGMEYVREVRDSNYLNNTKNGAGVSSLNGFGSVGGNPDCYTHGCKVDPSAQTPTIVDCGSTSCAAFPLYFDSGTYRYNQQNTGTKTIFTRTVQLSKPNLADPTEILVTVTVDWVNHGNKSVVLQEYFRDWL